MWIFSHTPPFAAWLTCDTCGGDAVFAADNFAEALLIQPLSTLLTHSTATSADPLLLLGISTPS